MIIVAATILCCYLIGSVPFGVLVARARGIDIREQGSRNIGATNVTRVLGRRAGAVVLVLDVIKGLVPTLLAGRIFTEVVFERQATHYALWVVAAMACVVGHICPVYLRFKGGKGVATGLGATFGLFPELAVPCGVAIVVWVGVTFGSGYVSLGSMAAALSFPVSAWLTLRPIDATRLWPVLLYTLLVPGLVIFRHRGNLVRLRDGTESKIGRKPP